MAGTYTQITEIIAPVSAVAGSRVDVVVRIKNNYSAAMGIMVGGALEHGVSPWPSIIFPADNIDTNSGLIAEFAGYFIMPSVSTKMHAYSYWYGADGYWYFDDEMTRDIALSGGGAAGIITNKELEYDSMRATIPASSVPSGKSGLVHIWGRNDTSSAQQMGITWTVVDPDGLTRESYSTWEAWPYSGAGVVHEFIGGRFLLNKAGTWTIQVQLKMNQSSPVVVDSYSGALCTILQATIPTGLHSTSMDVTYDTYDYGAAIPYVLGYEYKGEAQGGTLKVELGTGVYPYFTPIAVIGPVSYNFAKKTDYTRVTENRTFILPNTLVRGQTYSARVTLTTADGLTDNDIDYTALKVLDITVPSTDLQALTISTQYRDYALGENLPCSISFKYKGIAQSGTIQAFIKKGLALVYTYPPVTMQFERADTLTIITRDVNLELPRTLEPGQVYSLRIEIVTSDGKDTSETKGTAFKIASGEIPVDPGIGAYRKVKDYVYPYGTTYSGNASEATVEYTVLLAQMPGGDWLSKPIIDAFESKVTEQGGHMLQLVVYERDNGLTSKDYKVIAIASGLKEVAGQEYTPQGIVSLVYVTPQLGPVAWAAIILAALILIAIIVSMLSPTVRDVVWGEGGVVETVTDIGGMLGDILPMLILVMMMTMMMEMMGPMVAPEGAPPKPKPVTEAVVKGAKWVGKEVVMPVAKWVGKGAVELAEKGWEEAKELVSEARKNWIKASETDKANKLLDLRRVEEHEKESREKLREAKAELRKRREEQAKSGEQ